MAKKTGPHDFDIHQLADRSRARSHQMLRGAFRITPQSLRAFQAIFGEATGEAVKSTWLVLSATDEPKTLDTLDEVLALRNPQGNPIWGLFFNHVGRDANCRLFVTSADIKQYAALQFSTDAESPDKVSNLIAKVRGETKNIRLWYWPFRWLDDHLLYLGRKHGKPVALVFLILCFALFAIGAIGQAVVSFSNSGDAPPEISAKAPSTKPEKPAPELTEEQKAELQKRIEALQKELEAKQKEQDELQRKQLLKQVWQSLTWLGAGGAVLVSFLLARALFPRAVFEIGEGKERYQRLCTIRNFLICTLLLGGLLIPLARSYMMKELSITGKEAATQPGD